MRNERGFTLVEILASITILAILATVFFQMFIFSQKTTTTSKEKLVALNVAQGVMERIKHGAYPEIDTNHEGTYTVSSCDDPTTQSECEKRYKIKVNDIDYKIIITIDSEAENGLGIYWATVNVYGKKRDPESEPEDKLQSSVEGFVEI